MISQTEVVLHTGLRAARSDNAASYTKPVACVRVYLRESAVSVYYLYTLCGSMLDQLPIANCYLLVLLAFHNHIPFLLAARHDCGKIFLQHKTLLGELLGSALEFAHVVVA